MAAAKPRPDVDPATLHQRLAQGRTSILMDVGDPSEYASDPSSSLGTGDGPAIVVSNPTCRKPDNRDARKGKIEIMRAKTTY